MLVVVVVTQAASISGESSASVRKRRGLMVCLPMSAECDMLQWRSPRICACCRPSHTEQSSPEISVQYPLADWLQP